METKANETAAKDSKNAAEKQTDKAAAFDMTAPLRTMVETALDEYQTQADRWLDHGAAQVAEGFRAMKAMHAGNAAALRHSADAVMSAPFTNPFASMFTPASGRAA